MLEYTRQLKFDEGPDYEYLYKLIAKMMKDNNLIHDNKYDWMDDRNVVWFYKDNKVPKETVIEDLNYMQVDTKKMSNKKK